MLGAAPTCKSHRGMYLGLVSVVVGVATLLISAGKASGEVQAKARAAPVWGVALDGRQTDEPNLELLAQAKAAGVNAIVTDPKRWSVERHRRLASLARGLGMFLIEPRRPSKQEVGSSALHARCESGRRVHRPCSRDGDNLLHFLRLEGSAQADNGRVPDDPGPLGLRRRILLIFTLGALGLAAFLSFTTYGLVRSNLAGQRDRASIAAAYRDSRLVTGRLRLGC